MNVMDIHKLKKDAETASAKLSALLGAIRAPLPTATGDGSELPQLERKTFGRALKDIIRDVGREDIKELPQLLEIFKDGALGIPLEDRHYLMEAIVEAAAVLPNDEDQKLITNQFITTLWNDLEHPPQTLLGDDYQFRQPDGSKNSYTFPQMGAAGMPYARTVRPTTQQPGCLPDPGILFDTVMARETENGKEHPNKISSMLFYLASIIIHDIFKTDLVDRRISQTSSYLDLAPLYGSNWKDQKRMRTLKDGKIKPDCFSETRLLTFPPGVGALLIMFNRYHNYVVEQLASINEGGRFTENPHNPTIERYGEKINKRDDDLFQTARLITCGLYINIILIDYVRTILNLNETDYDWQLNPRVDIKDGPPRGTGNQVSAEFNLVYRWHAAVSNKDDEWTRHLFQELPMPQELKDPEEASKPENIYKFLGFLREMEIKSESIDPTERPFPALKKETMTRISEGPFKGNYPDDKLAEFLTASIEDCANAMGPRQVPKVMKMIEILGIQQARSMQCATLNEFRKHFNLKPHEHFEEITKNEEVQRALKHFYGTPDKVELYPGLVVEDAKEVRLPGSGLCPSYTVSRGVLSDAVALVRGDRFYTTAYTPALLTNWGFEEASSDITIDNGCVFYKLFMRALPNNFDPASVHIHYPLTVPTHMKQVLQRLDKAKMYTFDPPKSTPTPKLIFSYDTVERILKDPETFHVTWGPAMEFLMGPKAANFMLAGDGEANARSRELMEGPMYLGPYSRELPNLSGNREWLQAVRDFYEDITTKLLKQKTSKLSRVGQADLNEVDIIRDIGNLTHVHFAAELFSIPLKTESFPHGVFTEQQLYLVMAAVFIAVFFNLDPAKAFPLRIKSLESTHLLGDLIKAQVIALKAGKPAEWLISAMKPIATPLQKYGIHMLSKLHEKIPNVDELVWGNIVGTAGGMVANQGQLFGQALDYFFTDGLKYLPEINRLAKEDTPEADDLLMHYFMEGARLSGETGVFRSVQKDITLEDKTSVFGTKTHHLRKDDVIMLNLRAASHDPKVFPDPDKLKLDRPLESYIHFGGGNHQCFGQAMTMVALTTMLKVVGRLDNLRPASVAIGRNTVPSRVKKVVKEFEPGDSKTLPESWHYHLFVMEDWDQYFPFPTSLKINFDGDIPDVKPRTAAT